MSAKDIVNRLKISIFIIAVLPVVIFAFMAYFVNEEAVVRSIRVFEEKMSGFQNSSNLLSKDLGNLIGEILSVTQSPDFESADIEGKKAFLNNRFSSLSYIQEVRFYDSNGKDLFNFLPSGNEAASPSSYFNEKWISSAMEGRLNCSEVFFQRDDPWLNISFPVCNKTDRSISGILSVNISLGGIFKKNLDWAMKDDSFTYIMDDQGNVLFSAGKLRYLFPGITTGTKLEKKSSGSDGVPANLTPITGTVNIQNALWQITSMVKKPDTLMAAGRLVTNLAGAFILVMMFSLVLSHYVIKGVSRPLEDIAHIAKQIDTEDLAQGLPLVTMSEGPVDSSVSFDEMKQKIQKYLDDNKVMYSRTRERLEKRVVELRTIHSVTEAFTSIASVSELLDCIVEQMYGILPGKFCNLYLKDNKGKFRLRSCFDPTNEILPENYKDVEFPIDEEIFDEVKDSQKALIVHDVASEESLAARYEKKDIGAFCVFPLIAGEEFVGLLELGLKKGIDLSEGSIRLFMTIAKEASMAIQNAMLYQKMSREKAKIEVVFSSISDGLLTVDSNGIVTSFNKAAEKITGYSSDRVINKKCSTIFSDKHVPTEDEKDEECFETEYFYLLNKALSQGQFPLSSELKILTPSGESKTVEISSTLEQKESGDVSFVSVFRDISRIRELEELRSSFIDTMSHELRTPLTSIKGYVSTLLHPRAKFSSEEVQEFLGIINDETNHLNRMINDILEASKLQRDSLIIKQQPCKISDTIIELTHKLKVNALKHTFITEIAGNPTLYGDPHQLEFVLTHLMENAVKFSPDGGQIKVNLQAPIEKDMVKIMIEDQGIGVPDEHREKIFDLFHRVDNRSTRRIYGPGMGLYISKKIIEAHGGRIWVESKSEGGSIFTFTIPMYIEHELEIEDADKQEQI